MNISTLTRSIAITTGIVSLVFASAAHAVVTYDDNITPTMIFGSGNTNGHFTVDRASGVEIGLRAKVRFPSPQPIFNSGGDGTYKFKAGIFNGADNPQWNFEWSINTNYDGSGGNIDDYTYLLEMDFDPGAGTDFLAWDPISYPTEDIPYTVPANPGFYDHSMGTNGTANGAGVEAASAPAYGALVQTNNVTQNSWRYTFYDGAPFFFDANATGTYEIRLTAFQGMTVVAQSSIRVLVEGFVTPEVLFGSGNLNGNFTLDRSNGVELGLRAKQRFPSANIYNNNFDGSYTFLAGIFNGIENPQWNFEWSVNSDYTGLTGRKLDDYTYLLEMDFDPGAGTNFLAWDQISFPTEAIPYDVPFNPGYYDHSIGTNATANGAGVEATDAVSYAPLLPVNNVAQNSWRYTFYDGAPFLFDATSIGRYDIRLTAYDGLAVAAQVTAQVKVVESGTCFVDSECDDGLGCNGVETCNTTTNECEFGTEVDCSGLDDQCNAGACVDPAGTCAAVPFANGTACDSGDTCSIADTCQAGVCDAGGGGDTDSDGTCQAEDNCPSVANAGQEDADSDTAGDACDACPNDANDDSDSDGVCGDVDNCPNAANNNQANADADGTGDACDSCTDIDGDGAGDPGFPLNVCATDNCPAVANPSQSDADLDGTGDACDTVTSPTALIVSAVRLTVDGPTDADQGMVKVLALINDNDTGGDLATELLDNAVTMRVFDQGDFDATIPLVSCKQLGGHGRIRCETSALMATFRPTRQGPWVYGVSVVRRKLSTLDTGTAAPIGPVTVELTQGAVIRQDEISDCDAPTATRLSCTER